MSSADPTATEDHARFHRRTVFEKDRRASFREFYVANSLTGAQLDLRRRWHEQQPLRHVRPEDSTPRTLGRFEHDRHVSASLDRCRRFRAEESPADDRDIARGRCELFKETVQSHGVVVRSQCFHERTGRLVGERSCSSAGRDDDVRADDPRAARKLDRGRLDVQGDRSLAEQDRRKRVRELFGRRQGGLVDVPATSEHLL